MHRTAAALLLVVLAACTSRGARVDVPGLPADSIAAPRAAREQPYFEFQVERPARELRSGCAPAYPTEFMATATKGEVVAQFVVDEDGRPEPATFKVIRASHAPFAESVRAALKCIRYTPATIGGRRVRQIVQQPFVFDVAAR